MVYLIVPMALAVFPLAAIIYVALSKKTGPRTRIAALAALAVMFLSVIVCGILIFSGTALVRTGNLVPADLPVENPAAPAADGGILLAFIVFMAVLFAVVAVLSFREQRRSRNAKQASGSKAA